MNKGRELIEEYIKKCGDKEVYQSLIVWTKQRIVY